MQFFVDSGRGGGGFMNTPSNPYQRPAPRQDYINAINAANKREMEEVICSCFPNFYLHNDLNNLLSLITNESGYMNRNISRAAS